MLLLEYKYNDELAQHIISNLAKNKEMQFNELFRTVEKMYKMPRPSKRKYAKNIKLLEEMDLINRREERTKGGLKKVFFFNFRNWTNMYPSQLQTARLFRSL